MGNAISNLGCYSTSRCVSVDDIPAEKSVGMESTPTSNSCDTIIPVPAGGSAGVTAGDVKDVKTQLLSKLTTTTFFRRPASDIHGEGQMVCHTQRHYLLAPYVSFDVASDRVIWLKAELGKWDADVIHMSFDEQLLYVEMMYAELGLIAQFDIDPTTLRA